MGIGDLATGETASGGLKEKLDISKHSEFWFSSKLSDKLLIAGRKPLWALLDDGRLVEYTSMDCETGYGDESFLGTGIYVGPMSLKEARGYRASLVEQKSEEPITPSGKGSMHG